MARVLKSHIAGQQPALRSPSPECLPFDGSDPDAFGQVGILLGDRFEDDLLFRRATSPEGWRVEPAREDHTFVLRDQNRNPRATIIYVNTDAKRSARIDLHRRFGYRIDERDGKFLGVVTDAGEVGYRSKPQASRAKAEERALGFLKEYYSGWEHYNAYWP